MNTPLQKYYGNHYDQENQMQISLQLQETISVYGN
jgi:hypothetical protein